MECADILSTIRKHERELRAAGVEGLSIFGSVARNEPFPNDVDIAVRLAPDFSSGGFDYFGRLEGLERMLGELLGCQVDVVAEPVRKLRLLEEIERDRAIVF